MWGMGGLCGKGGLSGEGDRGMGGLVGGSGGSGRGDCIGVQRFGGWFGPNGVADSGYLDFFYESLARKRSLLLISPWASNKAAPIGSSAKTIGLPRRGTLTSRRGHWPASVRANAECIVRGHVLRP